MDIRKEIFEKNKYDKILEKKKIKRTKILFV